MRAGEEFGISDHPGMRVEAILVAGSMSPMIFLIPIVIKNLQVKALVAVVLREWLHRHAVDTHSPSDRTYFTLNLVRVG